MRKVNIGLIGFGTVGSGVVKAIRERGALIKKKVGVKLCLKKVFDKDIRTPRNVKINKSLLTKNINDILENEDIDIVVELIGGIHPAKEFIIKALKLGKDVVTANKALLAQASKEIFEVVRKSSRSISFEASVCAGIPIIKILQEGLISNRIDTLLGIINGTSNYILSEMTENNTSFITALTQAKARGYAEKNPSFDIKGIDSAHKLAILTLLGFGKNIKWEDIFTEGISRISLNDIRYAGEMGYCIKLLAIAKRVKDELELRVHPTLLPKEHLLSSVGGVFNAIYVYGDMIGESLYYGQGAGQLPAASAVISDIVDLALKKGNDRSKGLANLVYPGKIKKIRRIEEIETKYYIRFMVIDRPGVLAKISGILGKYKISIANVTQKERKKARVVPIVMMTHDAKERALRKALEEIDRLAAIRKKTVAIRVEAGWTE